MKEKVYGGETFLIFVFHFVDSCQKLYQALVFIFTKDCNFSTSFTRIFLNAKRVLNLTDIYIF